MTETFTPGQRIVCIKENPSMRDGGKIGDIFTVIKVIDPDSLMEISNGLSIYPLRFTDATKYLHNKEFKNKLDNLVEID
jgi:hypothetical protein